MKIKRLPSRLIKLVLFRAYILFHRWLHRIGVLPFSRTFGYERGTPVGRFYVDAFLRRRGEDR